MAKWLAVYSDDDGDVRAALVTTTGPETIQPCAWRLWLPDYSDGAPLTLVEMPVDDSFLPIVIDVDADTPVEIRPITI